MKILFYKLKHFYLLVKCIVPVLWSYAMMGVGVHWHIVGYDSVENYKIIWEELHKAHVTYERRLRAKANTAKRKRNKKGQLV